MKRLIFVFLTILILGTIIFNGCGGGSSTTTSTTTAVSTTSGTTTATSSTTTPGGTATSPTATTTDLATAAVPGAVSGGTLRAVITGGPAMMSYRGRMGPADATYTMPAGEYLVEPYVDAQGNRGWIPFLCQSYKIDPEGKTFTFNLRKGVKFTDGTDMTAAVVKWNFQQDIDNGWLQDADKITSIDTPDDSTVVIRFTVYSNQYEFNWGWTTIFSQAAWEANAGTGKSTTSEQGITWATTHIVGTGPFILQNYTRDVSMTWTKNPNYWQKGKPYLDGLEWRIITESTTASSLLQAGEIDLWYQGNAAQDWAELAPLGYKVVNYWPGLPQAIFFNTTDNSSKWQDIRLRQAVEYGINKGPITQALGRGYYVASDQIAPKTEWGYLPNLQTRAYDPNKAKQLCAEAGFPNGCPMTMLVQNVPASVDAAEALKQSLDGAGFKVTLDLADPGRFFGSVFGTGWADTVQMFYGMDVNYLGTYMSWFSTDPKSNLASFKRDAFQVNFDKNVVLIPDAAGQKAAVDQVMQHLYDQAVFTPLWWVPATTVSAKYVHHEIYRHGFIRVDWENVWMDKH
jgi:peptide/nickel transport system substrate-binding protein